jgi:hypothetical protein
MAIPTGSRAPEVPGDETNGPRAYVFYKVTCSVTQMAGPPIARLASAYPGGVVGVGQDPPDALAAFAEELGWDFLQVPDLAPYETSDAFEIRSAPTVVVVDADGLVADVVESWDRDGINRASATLAGLLGKDATIVSTADDGLPDFKPG